MTVEHSYLVRLRRSDFLTGLCRDIESARRRARKAAPGERTDIVRFESLCSQLEYVARVEMRQADCAVHELTVESGFGGPFFADLGAVERLPAHVQSVLGPWLLDGDIGVEVCDPFEAGERFRPGPLDGKVAPVAERWLPREGIDGRRAVALRFGEEVSRAVAGAPDAAVVPSGVANRVLTETLRSYVMGGGRVDAPVRYRDGSRARPFLLRCLPAQGEVPDSPSVLRCALLSIRHTRMDALVDGAWLRNVDVSRKRPAGETDELVFDATRRQLAALTSHGRLVVHLYQTGLETAVVGFYRAVVHQLLEEPGSVAVVPWYFQQTALSRPPDDLGVAEEGEALTHFARGTVWAV